MMARAALPAALFALGGVLYRYRPEGDMATIAWICVVTLVVYPAVIWVMGRALDISEAQFRSAVLTGAMGPGVNAYIFANMYGVARRVVASPIANPNAVNSIGPVTSDVSRRREMRPNRTIPVAMTAKP